MILQFDVVNQKIIRKDNNYVVANSQFYLQMDFNFTADWQGFGKTITFLGSGKKYSIGLNTEDNCVVPYDVIKSPSFSFSIKGILDDVIITTNICVIPIQPSGETKGIAPIDPPKEILAGLQNGLKGQVLGKLSDDNYDYEFQNLKELQYDDEHTLGDVLEGLVIDAVTDVIYENGKLKKQENGKWTDIVEMYDKDTIDTMLANLDKYIEKSDTPGLVKNDGTIDTTEYASQDDLNAAKTDLQGDIEALDTKLSQDISNEENARIAAISAEETARENADTALGGRIDNEASARSQADTALGGRIDTEIIDRGNAITAEATARENADNTLDGKITDEATARGNADNVLDGKITDEATARDNADTQLQNAINQEALDRQNAVSGEATLRDNADTALGGRIDTEITNRTNADTALGGRIDAEELARSQADTTLQGNIDAEALARQQADSAEANIRDTNDDALASAISDRLCIVKMNNVVLNNWTDVGIPQEFENYSYVAVIRDTRIIGAESVNILFAIEQILSDNYCPAPLVDNVEGTIKIFGNDNVSITLPSVEIFKPITFTLNNGGE